MAVVLQPGLHPARGSDGVAGRTGPGSFQGHGHPGNGAHGRVEGGPGAGGRAFTGFAGPGPLVLTESPAGQAAGRGGLSGARRGHRQDPHSRVVQPPLSAAPQGFRRHHAKPAGEPGTRGLDPGQAPDPGGGLGTRRPRNGRRCGGVAAADAAAPVPRLPGARGSRPVRGTLPAPGARDRDAGAPGGGPLARDRSHLRPRMPCPGAAGLPGGRYGHGRRETASPAVYRAGSAGRGMPAP